MAEIFSAPYVLQVEEPFWMPEIRLGIGRYPLVDDPLEREVLSWYGEGGDHLKGRPRFTPPPYHLLTPLKTVTKSCPAL